MKPSKTCYDFIKSKEGLELKAYKDVAGVWTIGYGTTVYQNQHHVMEGDVITMEQAEALLEFEVNIKAVDVSKALGNTDVNQNQYDALVSFTYNEGIGALLSSTLLRRVKADLNDLTIRDAFMMWDKARVDGQLVVVEGLKRRRAEEADLYFTKSAIA
jgi:lysozyme